MEFAPVNLIGSSPMPRANFLLMLLDGYARFQGNAPSLREFRGAWERSLGEPTIQKQLVRFWTLLFKLKVAERSEDSLLPDIEATCNILVTDVNGTAYGYLGTAFSSNGLTEPPMPPKPMPSPLNGPTAAPDAPFPFLGGIAWGNGNLGLYLWGYAYVPLGGTCETPPGENSRTHNTNNSLSAAGTNSGAYIRREPDLALSSHYVSPPCGADQTKGDETRTIIVRAHAKYQVLNNAHGIESFHEVTLKRVPQTLCNIYISKHGLRLLPPCMALEGQVGEGQEAGSGINEKAGAFGQRRGARYTKGTEGSVGPRTMPDVLG
ncbi:hypothetical protein DFH09DRAFT_1105604 [Mycena vulgaris]|nr:hypothetical protein DFH09DRAFT_1105604 [Mycena vulgaris]